MIVARPALVVVQSPPSMHAHARSGMQHVQVDRLSDLVPVLDRQLLGDGDLVGPTG